MDGPLISTQQTVVENDFNPKQRHERLHLTVGNLEYDVIPSKPDYEFTMDLAPMHLCYVCAVV